MVNMTHEDPGALNDRPVLGSLAKRLPWMLGFSLLITIVIYNLVLSGQIKRNYLDLNVLSSEQLHELGPVYADAGAEHVDFLDQSIEQINRREYALLLKVLYPEHSLDKALARAKRELADAVDPGQVGDNMEEIAKAVIHKVGRESHEYFLRGEKFLKNPLPLQIGAEYVPKEVLRDIDRELDAFHMLVKDRLNASALISLDVALDGAKDACVDSRRVYLKLVRSIAQYDNEKKINRFIADLRKAHRFAKECSERADLDDDAKRDLFAGRARNMGLRADVLKPLLAGDFVTVCLILDKAKTKVLLAMKGM